MTDTDSLFKKQSASTPRKRRLDDLSDLVKKYKGSDENEQRIGSSTVTNATETQEFDELVSDEEGGRFFGGGLSKEQEEILEYVDQFDKQAEEEEVQNRSWLKKQLTKLERVAAKNAQLRAKFAETPQKFIESEEELDRSIKGLSALTDRTELYADFVELGGFKIISNLLIHENSDIVADLAQVLQELTDDDVDTSESQLAVFVHGAIKEDVLQSLILNLSSLEIGENDLDNTEDYERDFKILSVIENFSSVPGVADLLFVDYENERGDTGLLRWILRRLLIKEEHVSQTKQYAAEILSITLQKSALSREQFCIQVYKDPTTNDDISGMDVILRSLAVYRIRDPLAEEVEEAEMFENLFDALVSVVQSSMGKDKLLENEGIDLLLLMAKHGGKHGKARAMKTIDYALSSGESSSLALDFVNNNGLPILFKQFMSPKFAEAKHFKRRGESNSDLHVSLDAILGIIVSLFRNLPDSAQQKMKLIAKFVEKDFEKVGKLLKYRRLTLEMLDHIDIIIDAERSQFVKRKPILEEEDKDIWETDLQAREAEWYIRRHESGGFRLQLVDVIIAWLAAEDDDNGLGIKDKIISLLRSEKRTLVDVKMTLEDYKNEISPDLSNPESDDNDQLSNEESEQRREASDLSDMLGVLMEFL
ncbi:Catenin-beta-like protein [Dipodascopsis uninucleata]